MLAVYKYLKYKVRFFPLYILINLMKCLTNIKDKLCDWDKNLNRSTYYLNEILVK